MARLEDHEGREALERQVCEVEALLAIFDGDDGVAIEVSGLAAVQAALDDDAADDEGGKTAIASAGEEDDACLRVVLTFADADALELSSVRMRLPLGYPERCGPEIDLGSKFLNERCESALECLVSEERGQECLFQVVQLLRESVDEGLRDLREEEEGDGDGDEGSSLIGGSVGLAGSVEALGLSDRTEAETSKEGLEGPAVSTSEPYTERKSTFQAHVATVRTTEEVSLAMERILSTKKVSQATHNILAYRLDKLDDYDDDGETGAGQRLLHMLRAMEVRRVLVCVTRWYGGTKLGPSRFAIINNVARAHIIQLGLHPPSGTRTKNDAGAKKKGGTKTQIGK